MEKVAYLGLDAHVSHSVLGGMGEDGEFWGNETFVTTEANLISAIQSVRAEKKYLALEEGTLAQWIAGAVREHVAEVFISDPKENALISKASDKKDKNDTKRLCRLLRLGELKRVYHPEDDDRAVFKAAVQQYLDLRDQQVALKFKIKAMYRHWGVMTLDAKRVYDRKHRSEYLKQIDQESVRNQLGRLYQVMDITEKNEADALKEVEKLGQRYPEIKRFRAIPGIGIVGANVFDAFVQTPGRFSNKQKLWRYSRLGIRERSSDGKPLGYKRLDRAGVGELKALSYRAWLGGMRTKNGEIRQSYEKSLQRTGDRIHARLNTQRKILAVMWGIWKRGEDYRPEVFLGTSH